MGKLNRKIPPDAIHLCIDMQRLFSDEGPWTTPWMPRVLPAIENLVRFAPSQTIFTRFIPPLRASDMYGTWVRYYQKWSDVTRERIDPRLLDLMPTLVRFAPPALVFDKMTYSAFSDGRLVAELMRRKTETLILTGSETDVCVLSTALGAVDLGYRVILVGDAICSSSDESHDAICDLCRRRFDQQIEITGIAAILEHWQQR
jgi:nicotinamidase-related amidase